MSFAALTMASMNETLEQLLRRDLDAWILAKAAIAKAKGGAA